LGIQFCQRLQKKERLFASEIRKITAIVIFSPCEKIGSECNSTNCSAMVAKIAPKMSNDNNFIRV